MEETGVGYLLSTAWIGIFVKAGTPPEIAARLHEHLVAVLRAPDVVTEISRMGGIPGGQAQERFAAFVTAERLRWRETIKTSQLSLD
ncbi:Tripartite tricarboxylate transporter family receptor [compost metagenome]